MIHFAGLISVDKSVARPLPYCDEIVSGSVAFFECMWESRMKTIASSSTTTGYGESVSVPIREDFPLSAANPYGRTKLIISDVDGICADTWSWQRWASEDPP